MAHGDQQRALCQRLIDAGYKPAPAPPSLHIDRLPPAARSAVMDIYRSLDGIQDRPALRTRGWDCPLTGGLIVELDELQHFNRFRARSLAPVSASRLPWRRDYLILCAEQDDNCFREKSGGGFWTTPGSEALFGIPDPINTREGIGSPRWKQRATTDAMRDIAAAFGLVKLARLSIFDLLGDRPLGDILTDGAPLDAAALRDLVAVRTLSRPLAM